MDIQLYLSKEGHAVFACSGRFSKPIDEIVLDPQTGLVCIAFDGYSEVVELNCALDMELCEKLKNEKFCALGYIDNGRLVASEYVRFRIGVPWQVKRKK